MFTFIAGFLNCVCEVCLYYKEADAFVALETNVITLYSNACMKLGNYFSDWTIRIEHQNVLRIDLDTAHVIYNFFFLANGNYYYFLLR